MRAYIHFLLACALSFAAAWAQAGVGIAELPGLGDDGPVTVYYPTSAPERPHRFGPFTLSLAPDAPPARGNGRLVVISHGSGGAPWVHADLARQLVEAGFVVALPTHCRDNWSDSSEAGPDSWKRRPQEAARAIDAVARAPRFAELLALDQVGLYGFSAGGHTALTLAGGRWTPGHFKRHCEANLVDDFHTCVGLHTKLRGDVFDGLKKAVAIGVIRQRYDDDNWQTHQDARFRAIVAGAPHAATFDTASLARPGVPVALVTVGQDKWLVPRFHSDRIVAACQNCEVLVHLPAAGHGALVSPQLPMASRGEIANDLMSDPPGFDRSVLPGVDRQIVAFLRKHLIQP
jgi:predicted dienelactone hydrolase